tara:strand:- start:12662 stop:21460 length:8799 start_codon:yes stop_codon:yes gene_type:complete
MNGQNKENILDALSSVLEEKQGQVNQNTQSDLFDLSTAIDLSPEEAVYNDVGKSLFEAVTAGPTAAVKTLTFDFLDLEKMGVVDKPKTKLGQASESIGTMGGYLLGYKKILQGGKIVVGGIGKQAAKGTKLGNTIRQADVQREGINKALKGVRITRDGKKVSRADFIKDVVDPELLNPIKNFSHLAQIFRSSKKMDANIFDDIMRTRAGEFLVKAGKQRGYTIGAGTKIIGGKPRNEVVDRITRIASDNWKNIGGRPINTLPDLISSSLPGSGRFNALAGHMVEDMLAYGVVEGGFVASRHIRGEEQLQTPQQFFTEMMGFGALAGALRFIPGGAPQGSLRLWKKQDRDNLKLLFGGTKKFMNNVKINGKKSQNNREDVLNGFSYFRRMRHPVVESSFNTSIYSKKNEGLRKMLKGDLTMDNLRKITQKGTPEEKEAAALLMKRAMNELGQDIATTHRKQFLEFIKTDWWQTKPRQLTGALLLGGAQQFMTGQASEVTPDNVLGGMLGYFMFKRGHKLQYKGKGAEADTWITGGSGWNRALGDEQIYLKEMVNFSEAMQFRTDHELWMPIRAKVMQSDVSGASASEMLKMAQLDIQSPKYMEADALINTSYKPKKGEKQGKLLFVTKNRNIQSKDISKKEREELNALGTDRVEGIRKSYDAFVEYFDNPSYLPQKNRGFKPFDSLNKKEVLEFESRIKSMGARIGYSSDIQILAGRIIKPTFEKSVSDLSNELVDLYSQAQKSGMVGIEFPTRPIIEPDAITGKNVYTFPRLIQGNIQWKKAEYANMFEEITGMVKYAEEFSKGTVKYSGKEIKVNEGDIDQDVFFSTMMGIKRGFTNNYKASQFSDEGIDRPVTFSTTDWVFQQSRTMKTIFDAEDIVEFVPKVLDSQAGLDASSLPLIRKQLQDVFQENDAWRYRAEHFNLTGLNKKNKAFIETIAPMLRSQGNDSISFKGNEKKLKDSDVTPLRNSFISSGYVRFKNDEVSPVFNDVVDDLMWKEDFLSRRKIDENGDLTTYDNRDREIITIFEEANILTNRRSTSVPAEIVAVRSLNTNEIQKADSFVKYIDEYVQNPQDAQIHNDMHKALQKVHNDLDPKQIDELHLSLIKDIQTYIEPYMYRFDEKLQSNVGHLRPSTEKYLIFDADIIRDMRNKIEAVKVADMNYNLTTFAESVAEMKQSTIAQESQLASLVYKSLKENSPRLDSYYTLLMNHGYMNNKTRQLKRPPKNDKKYNAYYNDLRDLLNQESKKSWGDVNQEWIDKTEKILDADANNLSEVNNLAITLPKFISKYGTDLKNNSDNPLFQEQSQYPNNLLKQLQEYHSIADIQSGKLKGLLGWNGDTAKFLKDLRKETIKTNKDVDVDVLDQELISIGATLNNKTQMRLLTFDQEARPNQFEYVTMEQNLLLDSLEDIFKVNGLQDSVFMINNSGFARNSYRPMNSFKDEVFMSNALRKMTSDGYAQVNNKLIRNKQLDDPVDVITGAIIPIRLNRNTVIGIKMDDSVMREIANNYVDWRKANKLAYDAIEGIIFDEVTQDYKTDFNKNAEETANKLTKWMQDLIFGKPVEQGGIGYKTWQKIDSVPSKDQYKGLKYFKLHDNKSAKVIKSVDLKTMIKYIDGRTIKNPKLLEMKKTMQGILNNEYNIVYYTDESVNKATKSKTGGVQDIFSSHTTAKTNFDNEFKSITGKEFDDLDSKDIQKFNKVQRRAYDAIKEDLGQKDTSIVDGATFQPKELAELQAMLSGRTLNELDEVSGNKLIGQKADSKGELVPIKTAKLPNIASKHLPDELTSADNSKTIFVNTSSAKAIGNYSDEFYNKVLEVNSFNDFIGIDDFHKNPYTIEDFKLLSTKGKKEGKMVPNFTGYFYKMPNHVNVMNDFIEYNMTQNVRNNNAIIKQAFSSSDRMQAKELFFELTLAQSRIKSAELNDVDTQAGVLLKLAQHGIDPIMFRNQFFNMFDKKYMFDDKLKFSNDAVIHPDMTGSLKSTIADKQGVITYGESLESWVTRNKTIEQQNMAFIMRDAGGLDTLVHYEDLRLMSKKDLQTAFKLTSKESAKLKDMFNQKFDTMGQLYDYISPKGKAGFGIKNMQIASIDFRNPISKMNSIIVTGIKDFGGKNEKNKKVMGALDVINHLKGDYDIDNVISIYAQPKSVWYGFNDLMGQHIYTPESNNAKNNFDKFELKNRQSLQKLISNERVGDQVKGTAMNLPSQISWLVQPKTRMPHGETVQGLVIKTGVGRYVKIKDNFSDLKNTDIEAKIDEFNQDALDAETGGYNVQKLTKDKMLNRIFTDQDGILEVIVYKDGNQIKQNIQGDTLRDMDKFVFYEYLKIRDNLLLNSGGNWSSGEKKTAVATDEVRAWGEYSQKMKNPADAIKKKIRYMFADENGKLDPEVQKVIENLNFNGHNMDVHPALKLSTLKNQTDAIKATALENVLPLDYKLAVKHEAYHKNVEYGAISSADRLIYDAGYTTWVEDVIVGKSDVIKDDWFSNQKFEEQNQAIQELRNKLNSLREQRNEFLNINKFDRNDIDNKQIKYFDNAIDNVSNFIKKQSKTLKEMSLDKKLQQQDVDSIKNYIRSKIQYENQKNKIEMTSEELDGRVQEEFKKSIYENARQERTIFTLAVQNFSGSSLDAINGRGGKLSDNVKKDIEDFRKDYNRDFIAVTNKGNENYAPQDFNMLAFNYEGRLLRLIQENGLKGVQVDAVLHNIMAPSLQKNKYSVYNGIYSPVSDNKGFTTRMMLALRFNAKARVESLNEQVMSDMFFKDFAEVSNKSIETLIGSTNLEYISPHMRSEARPIMVKTFMPNQHSKDLLDIMSPFKKAIEQSNLSQLSFYERFYFARNSGLEAAMLNSNDSYGGYVRMYNELTGKDVLVDGMPGFKTALDEGSRSGRTIDGNRINPLLNVGPNPNTKPPKTWASKGNHSEMRKFKKERAKMICNKTKGMK